MNNKNLFERQKRQMRRKRAQWFFFFFVSRNEAFTFKSLFLIFIHAQIPFTCQWTNLNISLYIQSHIHTSLCLSLAFTKYSHILSFAFLFNSLSLFIKWTRILTHSHPLVLSLFLLHSFSHSNLEWFCLYTYRYKGI